MESMTEAQKINLEKLAFGNEAQAQMAMLTAIGIGGDAPAFVADRMMVRHFIQWLGATTMIDVEINTSLPIDKLACPTIAKKSRVLVRKVLKKWGIEKQVKI